MIGGFGVDFYPRSPCGERRWLRCWQLAVKDISIHALLAESDVEKVPADVFYQAFLSTLSLRRATKLNKLAEQKLDFYPRSPCGERPIYPSATPPKKYFYPRSPCGERPVSVAVQSPASQFLSTLSLRRATYRQGEERANQSISIHALLAESDERSQGKRGQIQISIHALLAESD